MFDFLREHLEQNITKQAENSIQQIVRQRYLNKCYYLFNVIASGTALLILVYAYHLYEKNGRVSFLIAGTFISGLLILVSLFLSKKYAFLAFFTNQYLKLKRYFAQRCLDDLFYHYFSLIVISIYLPIAILITSWFLTLTVSSAPSEKEIDLINLMMSLSLAILGGQLTLFVFMFGTFVGKYSSSIAKVIIKHKVIFWLWFYPIISLCVLWIYRVYGAPTTIHKLIAPFFFVLDIICICFTVWVCFSGINTERVLTYVGTHAKKMVKKSLKNPLFNTKGFWVHLWQMLNLCGLDWRDPERLRPFNPPQKPVKICHEYLGGLFNAANKSIQENNEGLLRSILCAIAGVIDVYIKKRAPYYGRNDSVLSYCNNQMSALLKASSKSLNEYMITDVIKCVGTITHSTLEIEEMPKSEVEGPFPHPPKEHNISLFWTGLLQEGFDLSHTLMRSTAANEAIAQIRNFSIKALCLGYSDLVRTRFIEGTRKIHGECIKNFDCYHFTLANSCLENILLIWGIIAKIKRSELGRGYSDLHKDCATAVTKMAKLQFQMKVDLAFFSINNPVTILTSKISEKNILQDIFIFDLNRPCTEDWELGCVVTDLECVIDCVVELGNEAIANNSSLSHGFSEALFEIGYFIFRGIPLSFDASKNSAQEDRLIFSERETPQNRLEKKILSGWYELFPKYYVAQNLFGNEWAHNLIALLGIAFIGYSGNKDAGLKVEIDHCIKLFLDLANNRAIPCSLREDKWEYVQLLGAWINYFFKDEEKAEEIAKIVAQNRSFHKESIGFSSSQRFSMLGYPEVMIHNDFYLPWLRNLQQQKYVNKTDWDEYRKWQNLIMNPDMLIEYHKVVEKYRKSLREDYYRRRRETKQF